MSVVFFFKQKTAYELRISDWSSDVCSSDLAFHTLMEPGCHIVASTRLYGGSLNQIGHSFRKMDWHASFVDTDDPANVAAAITDKTRCIFVERLANPGGVVRSEERRVGKECVSTCSTRCSTNH